MFQGVLGGVRSPLISLKYKLHIVFFDCICRNIVLLDCIYRNIVLLDCICRNIVLLDCICRNIVLLDCICRNIVLLDCICRNIVLLDCICRNIVLLDCICSNIVFLAGSLAPRSRRQTRRQDEEKVIVFSPFEIMIKIQNQFLSLFSSVGYITQRLQRPLPCIRFRIFVSSHFGFCFPFILFCIFCKTTACT